MILNQTQILAEILTEVTSNGRGDITGDVMRGVLTDMTTTLNGSNFLFPVDISVTNEDVGKLMMKDGITGLARVYRLSPLQSAQLGQWTFTPGDPSIFSSSSELGISTGGQNYYYYRTAWSDNPYNPAVSVPDELSQMVLFLQGQPLLSSLRFQLSNDGTVLYIQERYYNATTVSSNSMGSFTLQAVQSSAPALLPAATSYPLGKLVGLTDSQAIITCNPVDTYTLQTPIPSNIMGGTFTTINSLFDYSLDLQLASSQSVYNILNQIIIPADGGTVTPFDITPYDLTSGQFLLEFRNHFLGIALSATPDTVTIQHFNSTSLLLSVFLRAVISGVFQLKSGSGETITYPPATGSGSGSGYGWL